MTKRITAEEAIKAGNSSFTNDPHYADLATLEFYAQPNKVEGDRAVKRLGYKKHSLAYTLSGKASSASKRLEFFDKLDLAIRTEVELMHRPFALYYVKHPGEIRNLLKHTDKRMVNSVYAFLMQQLENTHRSFNLSATTVRKAIALQKLYDIEPLLFVLLQDTNSIDTLLKFVGMFEGQTITMPSVKQVDAILRAATSKKKLDEDVDCLYYGGATDILPLETFVTESIKASLAATSTMEDAMHVKLARASPEVLMALYRSLMKTQDSVTTLAMEAENNATNPTQ